MTETEYRDKQLNAYYNSQKFTKDEAEIKKWIINTLKEWAKNGFLQEDKNGDVIIPDKIEDDDGYIYTLSQWFGIAESAKLWQELQDLYEEGAK